MRSGSYPGPVTDLIRISDDRPCSADRPGSPSTAALSRRCTPYGARRSLPSVRQCAPGPAGADAGNRRNRTAPGTRSRRERHIDQRTARGRPQPCLTAATRVHAAPVGKRAVAVVIVPDSLRVCCHDQRCAVTVTASPAAGCEQLRVGLLCHVNHSPLSALSCAAPDTDPVVGVWGNVSQRVATSEQVNTRNVATVSTPLCAVCQS